MADPGHGTEGPEDPAASVPQAESLQRALPTPRERTRADREERPGSRSPGVNLPDISLQPRPAGATKQGSRSERTPTSARAPPSASQDNSKFRRARSTDRARAASPAEDRRRGGRGEKTPAHQSAGEDAFLRQLLDCLEAEDGDFIFDAQTLAKLEQSAGHSIGLQELLKAMQDVRQRLSGDNLTQVGQPLEAHQLAAQVPFLERKILRLREKLKRKAKEATLSPEAKARQPLKVPVASATDDELREEIVRLRKERERLEAARKTSRANASPRPTGEGGRGTRSKAHRMDHIERWDAHIALKRRLASAQAQMKDLAAEKKQADEQAETARKLAEKVETYLKDAVLARESQRIKLEAEREVLRHQIREQDRLLEAAATEGIDATSGSSRQELDQLRSRVLDAERELAAVRRERQRVEQDKGVGSQQAMAARQSTLRSGTSPSRGPSPDADRLRGHAFRSSSRSSTQRLTGCLDADAVLAQVAGGSDQQKESAAPISYEELVEARQAAEKQLADVSAQLSEARAKSEQQLQELQQELKQTRMEAQKAEHKRRRQLANEAERTREELGLEAGGTLIMNREQNAVEKSAVDTEAVREAERELTEMSARFEAVLKREQEETKAKLRYLQSHLAFRHEEMVQSREHYQVIVRRQRDLRGRFYLAIRDISAYCRKELVHFLSCALGIPSSNLRIMEEVLLPQDTPMRRLVRKSGRPAGIEADSLDAFVRPLRSSTDGGIEQGGGEQAEEKAAALTETTAQAVDGSAAAAEAGVPEGEQATTDGAAAGGSAEAESSTLRVMVDLVLDGEKYGSKQSLKRRAELVDRLVKLVEEGGSLLEDIGVVGVCSLRGGGAFDNTDAFWQPACAEVVMRSRRIICKRDMVISCYRQLDSSANPMVKMVAVDNEVNPQEYIICLDSADLNALLGHESLLLRRHLTLGQELMEVLVDLLHVVECNDGTPALVALHSVPTLGQEDGQQPAAQLVLEASAAEADTPEEATSTLPEWFSALAGNATFEDCLLLDDRFFTLKIMDDVATGTTTVQLQETGVCKSVEVVLPGRVASPSERQLRICAQAYEFGNLTVLVAVEEIALPPALVVRIARGRLHQPLSYRDPEQQVFWLSRMRPAEDGSLCRCLLSGSQGVGGPVLSAVPAKHRGRLFRAAHEALRSGFFAAGNSDNLQEGGHISGEKAVSLCWYPDYGDSSTKQGMVLRDPTVSKPAREASVARVATKLLDSAKGFPGSGRPLLKMGRRVPGPGSTSPLCVLTVREFVEPFLHFTITAHQVGTCRSFEVLVDSLGVYRLLKQRVASGVRNPVKRRALARKLLHCCELVKEGSALNDNISRSEAVDGLRLILYEQDSSDSEEYEIANRGEDQGEMGSESSTRKSRMLEHKASRVATAAGLLIAPQVLSQDEAAELVQDASTNQFLVLRCCRPMGERHYPADVRIYDEPDAPEAAFLVNNLLVVVYTQGIFFSMRLHDNALQQPLLPEEMHMLDPDNRLALLDRIFGSLDVCQTAGQHGGTYDRLVMQPFLTAEVPKFSPDESGVLVAAGKKGFSPPPTPAVSPPNKPAPPEEEKGEKGRRSTQKRTTMLLDNRLRDVTVEKTEEEGQGGESNEESKTEAKPMQFLEIPDLRTSPLSPPPGPAPSVVYVGAHVPEGSGTAEMASDWMQPTRKRLANRRQPFGEANVEAALLIDVEAHSHILQLRQYNDHEAFTGEVLEVQVPASDCQSRMYMEHRMFAGEPIIVCISQQPFPHEVRAVIFDPKSHEEIDFKASDQAIVMLIERSVREAFFVSLEQMLKYGSLGHVGSGHFRVVNSGREIFPFDFTARALRRHVPVVLTKFVQLAHEAEGGAPVVTRDLVFACTRYVVGNSMYADEIGADDELKDPDSMDFDTVPLLRISLTKKSYCQDFTLSIEDGRATGEDAHQEIHMVNIMDKLRARPLGVFAEIQTVADLRLIVIFLDDGFPRSLRIAIVEPKSGWSFQLFVVDRNVVKHDDAEPEPCEGRLATEDDGIYLIACKPRSELLQVLTKRFGFQKPQEKPQSPTLGGRRRSSFDAKVAQEVAQLVEKPVSIDHIGEAQMQQWKKPKNSQAETTKEILAAAADVTPAADARRATVLARETRFFGDDMDVALLTVSFEHGEDGVPLLRCTASEPATMEESMLLFVNPGLDRLLQASGLPEAAALGAMGGDEAHAFITQEPQLSSLLKTIFSTVEIETNPFALEFQLSRLPDGDGKKLNLDLPVDGVDQAGKAVEPEAELECLDEKLVGRRERMWIKEKGRRHSKIVGEGPGKLQPTLRVEVFDSTDCVEAVFHTIHLRIRITDLEENRSATRDVHEGDLQPWLAEAEAEYLLCASREQDLIDLILRHAIFVETSRTGKESPVGRRVVGFEAIYRDDLQANWRFQEDLFEALEAAPGE
eukprot:TRINITY_DN11378_c0_g1_i8.p1 TRINITY_DN11378_c0_g1~~TRINITY_DN11378_c0_g1_i8.p1  ORF type:complete len:2407 (-),score=647.18 TRINITY_DN11378_c0_g1_i8:186-7406(-)